MSCRLDTPIGPLTIVGADAGVQQVFFGDGPNAEPCAVEEQAAEELTAWFAGRRRHFEVALAPGGTAFQQRVWALLKEIPFGQTRSYGDLAVALGQPGAARAVGLANHHNPLPIFIPCHRVLGSSGKLVGYAGGLDIKRWLLRWESGGLFGAREQ